VGKLARQLFPGGVEVRAGEPQEAIRRTRELVSNPEVSAIFEGAFEHDGVLVRVDVLQRRRDGKWRLVETPFGEVDRLAKGLLAVFGFDPKVQRYSKVCHESPISLNTASIPRRNGNSGASNRNPEKIVTGSRNPHVWL
jgi:hypothetical protein